MKFEYGIRGYNDDPDDPHRTGMSLEEAQDWIGDWYDMGGSPGVFSIIRREIGPWETP